jgi:hypothetical protein
MNKNIKQPARIVRIDNLETLANVAGGLEVCVYVKGTGAKLCAEFSIKPQ